MKIQDKWHLLKVVSSFKHESVFSYRLTHTLFFVVCACLYAVIMNFIDRHIFYFKMEIFYFLSIM